MTRNNIQLFNRISLPFPACVTDFPVWIKHMKLSLSDCMEHKFKSCIIDKYEFEVFDVRLLLMF